jgi:Xaa-Pro aminopeptidase
MFTNLVYITLEVDMVAVEPGICYTTGSDCDKKWWGIAVRIEDDILITANGPKFVGRST